MLFQLKKLPEIINLTRFLKSFWILYIDQIIVYNTFYSTLTLYIIKDRCQMHALNVFRSPVWLLLHKLSSPHYRYICKMRRGDRLPLTQLVPCITWTISRTYYFMIPANHPLHKTYFFDCYFFWSHLCLFCHVRFKPLYPEVVFSSSHFWKW